MDTGTRPVRTTILFGLVGGLVYLPLHLAFQATGVRPLLFRVAIFCILAAYSVLLALWAKKRRTSILFPLFLMFLFLFSKSTPAALLLLALGLLSWIRSGICFEHAFSRSLLVELALSVGGGALVAYFHPHSAVTWALGIWLFFLIQSLYFLFMEKAPEDRGNTLIDPFDQARMRVETILKQG
jgi:hypothetical protein